MPARIPSIVTFSYQAKASFRAKTQLKQFIPELARREGKRVGELSYVFCSDAYLLKLNRQFLRHDEYTDIVTFDLSDSPDFINGEIYISVDRVRDNSKILGSSFQDEIRRVIFHGVLHLCGFKDKTPADRTIMGGKEDQYLRLFSKRLLQ